MATSLDTLLMTNAVRCGGYWRGRAGNEGLQVWEKAAEQDAVYAAVSAENEDEERRKTVDVVGVLRDKLNDGVCLDVGCGYGRIAKYLLPYKKLAGYIGVDGSVTMLRLFSERYVKSAWEKETPLLLINSSIDDIFLQDSSVDNVIVAAVFLHNDKRVIEKSLDEIYRTMKPEARIFAFGCFPNRFSLRGLQGVLYLGALKVIGQGTKNGPVRFFSETEVRQMFRKFRKTEVHPVGFSMMPRSLLILPKSWRLFYRKRLYPKLESWVADATPENLKRDFCAYYDVIACK